MPERTYLYGYPPAGAPPTRLTLAGLVTRLAWSNLDPEFRRRLLAMFDHGHDVGIDVGIGGGWRSSAQQEQVFRARYHVVACPGSIQWDGKCWAKNPGVAPSAPPGRSYHETTTPGGAIAADLIGDIGWADTVAARFGLRSLGSLTPPNNELWHHQPLEVPTARRNYDGRPLARFPLPDEPPDPDDPGDDDDMAPPPPGIYKPAEKDGINWGFDDDTAWFVVFPTGITVEATEADVLYAGDLGAKTYPVRSRDYHDRLSRRANG